MPNPTPAKYTVQLGPTVTPQVAAELATWAEMLGCSVSAVTRQCIDAGLQELRPEFAATAEASPTSAVALMKEHMKAAGRRGQTQVDRRREYDERTRGTSRNSAVVTESRPDVATELRHGVVRSIDDFSGFIDDTAGRTWLVLTASLDGPIREGQSVRFTGAPRAAVMVPGERKKYPEARDVTPA